MTTYQTLVDDETRNVVVRPVHDDPDRRDARQEGHTDDR